MTATSTTASPDLVGDPDEGDLGPADFRAAGIVALVAVGLCVVGAVLNQAIVDVNLWNAMDASTRAEQADLLDQVADDRTPIVAGMAVWMIGFPVTCLASVLLAGLSRRSTLTEFVRVTAIGSVGAMIVFLSAFISFAAVIAPAHVAGDDVFAVARGIGYLATTADWVVTVIVLGLAPIGAVYAGRHTWAPRWLQAVAAVTGVTTAVLVAGLLLDSRDIIIVSVPGGLVLIACAGICALRHRPA